MVRFEWILLEWLSAKRSDCLRDVRCSIDCCSHTILQWKFKARQFILDTILMYKLDYPRIYDGLFQKFFWRLSGKTRFSIRRWKATLSWIITSIHLMFDCFEENGSRSQLVRIIWIKQIGRKSTKGHRQVKIILWI